MMGDEPRKPQDVRFHHIRDWIRQGKFRMKHCDKCDRSVPWFHEHIDPKYVVKKAIPIIGKQPLT